MISVIQVLIFLPQSLIDHYNHRTILLITGRKIYQLSNFDKPYFLGYFLCLKVYRTLSSKFQGVVGFSVVINDDSLFEMPRQGRRTQFKG
jgi:hypothetical protein